MNYSFAMFLDVEFENWINQCEGVIVAEIPDVERDAHVRECLAGKKAKMFDHAWLGDDDPAPINRCQSHLRICSTRRKEIC